MTPQSEPVEEEKKSLFRRKKHSVPLSQDDWVNRTIRTWKVNDKPLKSIIHMTTQLGIGVDVYTYLDTEFRDSIEHWLARKGAAVSVYCYEDVNDLSEDLKYNRSVHTLFTPYEEDAKVIGWHRATVVAPTSDGSFGVFGF